jgi:hypothetical protein
MEQAYEGVRDYRATLLRREPLNDVMQGLERINIKFQEPGRLYMKWVDGPNKGREVLFVRGQNENLALINEPFIPFTIETKPDGKTVLSRSRHPITETGLGAMIALLKKFLGLAMARNELTVSAFNEVDIEGVRAAQFEVSVPRDSTGYLGHRAIVTISKETALPVGVEILTADGSLLGLYSYRNVQVNPGLSDADFDSQNRTYGFWRWPRLRRP